MSCALASAVRMSAAVPNDGPRDCVCVYRCVSLCLSATPPILRDRGWVVPPLSPRPAPPSPFVLIGDIDRADLAGMGGDGGM